MAVILVDRAWRVKYRRAGVLGLGGQREDVLLDWIHCELEEVHFKDGAVDSFDEATEDNGQWNQFQVECNRQRYWLVFESVTSVSSNKSDSNESIKLH